MGRYYTVAVDGLDLAGTFSIALGEARNLRMVSPALILCDNRLSRFSRRRWIVSAHFSSRIMTDRSRS